MSFCNSGVKIGETSVLPSDVFDGIYSTEYFDGPCVGFAFFETNIIYFEKVWWDGLQNNRLFHLFEVEISKLESKHDCIIKQMLSLSHLEKVCFDAIAPTDSEAKGLAMVISSSEYRKEFNVLCRNLTENLLVLPVIDEQ